MIDRQLLVDLGFVLMPEASVPFHPDTMHHAGFGIMVIYGASENQIAVAHFIHERKTLGGERASNKILLDLFLECFKDDLIESARIVFGEEED